MILLWTIQGKNFLYKNLDRLPGISTVLIVIEATHIYTSVFAFFCYEIGIGI